jgi:starvation-inducible outer membrane lipoprotein
LGFRGVVALAAAIAMALLLAGCPGIPNDGRYQDHDGGRSNFRA